MNVMKISIIRFGIVGCTSNLLVFLFYLAFTSFGLGYKSTMSFLYLVGVLLTFNANKKWTFNHSGNLKVAFLRYVSLYAVGYLINLFVLITAVDRFAFRHQWVQGVMIFVLAVFLFFGQKLWVFRHADAA